MSLGLELEKWESVEGFEREMARWKSVMLGSGIGVHNNYVTCDWTDQNLFGQVDPIYKISHTICSMLAIRTVIIVKTKIFAFPSLIYYKN